MDIIGTFIIIAAFIASISIVAYTIKTGISPMPSGRRESQAIAEFIPHNFRGTVVDLGSGWGTLTSYLAKLFPGATVLGYELSPIPLWFSRLRGPRNVNICRKNFFETPLPEDSIIICYLFPRAMQTLKSKLEKELLPGTLIISNTFAIPGWEPIKIKNLRGLTSTQIYCYHYDPSSC
ncbi:MAG: class I SAM-dependent methyltransferase [Chlamydiota bacterium]